MMIMMLLMGLGLIVPLLLIGVVAYATVFRLRLNPTRPGETSPTPLETAKTRYARGEISGEEYEQIHRALPG